MFAIKGVRGLWDAGLELIGTVKAHAVLGHISWIAVTDLFGIALCFGFAWGLVTWANWAHLLLVPWYALACVAIALKLLSDGVHFFGKQLGVATFIWLLLPSVRREYWRRERVA